MGDKGIPIDYRSPEPRVRRSWRAILRNPWGQMAVYVLTFFVLGFGVAAFFRWVREPARSHYVPWDAPAPAATDRR
jgi:hypothetical protein